MEKKSVLSGKWRALGVVAAAAGLWMGTSGSAMADVSHYVNVDGCTGYLVVEPNFNGTGHDGASATFENVTFNYGHEGWTCSFVLQRSTDNGATWSNLSAFHDGLPGDNQTGEYYDGPGYMARLEVSATNQLGNWTDFEIGRAHV